MHIMNTRLSAWKYIKNNKKTVGVLTISLALSFMVMYVIYVLLMTNVESFKPIQLELPKKISYLSITGKAYGLDRDSFETDEQYSDAYNEKQNELIEKLKKKQGIDDAFYTQIISSRYNAVVGSLAYESPLLEPEQIPDFLKHMDATLVEGRLPKGDGEVLVDKTVMKNQGLELNQWYLEKWYGQTFKIVGVIESDYMINVGTPRGFTNTGWYIVVLNDENNTDMKKILKEFGITTGDADEIMDRVATVKNYNKDVSETIDSVIKVIYIVVIVFLIISVLVAYISFMRNRINEYCLYASIGYGRSSIYGMMMKEMLIIFSVGTISGILLALAGAFILKTCLIDPMGLMTKMLYIDQMGKLIDSYVFIMGLLQIPVLISINSVKTIDAIEET